MATVGISPEQTVVRGVVLSVQQGRPPAVLREMERPVEQSAAASVAATLEALTGTDADIEIDDVAIAYRTVPERRAIVSHLSSASWHSSSLVSTKTALRALLDDLPELAEHSTVLVLEVLGYHTAYLVVGPRRDEILASGSWSSGVVDADTASQAIGRIRSALEAAGSLPDVVVLCGTSAGKPDVVSAVRLGLAAPVTIAPHFANAAAYGAALVAAAPFRSVPAVAVPAGRRQTGRAILVAAAIAALAGGAAAAVVQAPEDRPANTEIRGPVAGPALAQEPMPQAQPVIQIPAAPPPAVDPMPVATTLPYPEPSLPPAPPPVSAEAQLPGQPEPPPPPMPPDLLPGQPYPGQPPTHRPHPTTSAPEYARAPAEAQRPGEPGPPPPMPPDLLPGQPYPGQPPTQRPHPTTSAPEHAPAPAGAPNDSFRLPG
ncbi:hypothetical protein IU459_27950 [Nocardia amamiensis]|uniref:FHA domain-containing protein n=1 Tax=Nocardia amamiensis TaxID=404578 RepID=A0ABS0CXL7_9NOCA|nr:hypothetical protein [Nocardia amamiensis]MBF6301344.1 hypothetical protein [Nocardia amamiensis]